MPKIIGRIYSVTTLDARQLVQVMVPVMHAQQSQARYAT